MTPRRPNITATTADGPVAQVPTPQIGAPGGQPVLKAPTSPLEIVRVAETHRAHMFDAPLDVPGPAAGRIRVLAEINAGWQRRAASLDWVDLLPPLAQVGRLPNRILQRPLPPSFWNRIVPVVAAGLVRDYAGGEITLLRMLKIARRVTRESEPEVRAAVLGWIADAALRSKPTPRKSRREAYSPTVRILASYLIHLVRTVLPGLRLTSVGDRDNVVSITRDLMLYVGLPITRTKPSEKTLYLWYIEAMRTAGRARRAGRPRKPKR